MHIFHVENDKINQCSSVTLNPVVSSYERVPNSFFHLTQMIMLPLLLASPISFLPYFFRHLLFSLVHTLSMPARRFSFFMQCYFNIRFPTLLDEFSCLAHSFFSLMSTLGTNAFPSHSHN